MGGLVVEINEDEGDNWEEVDDWIKREEVGERWVGGMVGGGVL